MADRSASRRAGSRWPAPPTWGRRRCRWAPAASTTSSSGCGPGGEVSAFPAALPAPAGAAGRRHGRRRDAAVPVPRVAVRRRGPLRGDPVAGRRRRPAAARRPRRAVGGRGAAAAGCGWRPSRRPTRLPPRAARRAACPSRCRRRRRRPARCSATSTPSLEHAWHPVARCTRAAPRRLAAGPPARPHLDAAPGRATAWPPTRPPAASGERLGLIWLAPGRAGRRPPGGARGRRPRVRRRLAAAGALRRAGRPAGRQLPRRRALPVRARGDVRRRRRDRRCPPTTSSTSPAGSPASRSSGATTRRTPAVAAGRPAAAPAPAGHLRLPGAVPAPAAAGVPRLRRGRPRSCSCSSPRTPTRPGSTPACCSPPAPAGRCPPPRPWPRRSPSSRRCSPRTSTCRPTLCSTGLPLVLRDELHVRADRLGVALRRALTDFAAAPAGQRAA